MSAHLTGTIETDDGIVGVEVRGTSVRISGDAELSGAQLDEFAVLYVRACWEAGRNAGQAPAGAVIHARDCANPDCGGECEHPF